MTEAVATPADIARDLRTLAEHAAELGAEMEYAGGFGPMGEHGRELRGAAAMMLDWADCLESTSVD